MTETPEGLTEMAAEDLAEEAAHFAGAGPLLDDLVDAAETACEALSDEDTRDIVAFEPARRALEDLDFDTARELIVTVLQAAEHARAQLDALARVHRVAVAAKLEAGAISAAITRGCAGVPKPEAWAAEV